MSVKLKDHSRPPLLTSIRDVIAKALGDMIDELKKHYNATDTNLVYLTLHQPGMQNALNSGGFSLQESTTNSILHFIMNIFNRFVNSNSEIRINEGFHCYFKVLSMAHYHWTGSRRKPGNFGCSNDENIPKIPGCVEIGQGFLENAIAFKNKCLLTSVILCFHANEYYRSGKKELTHLNLRPLYLKTFPQKKIYKAGQTMITEINKLISDLSLPNEGPYDSFQLLPILAAYFKCQIHVVKSTRDAIASYDSFPSAEWNNNQQQIFLFPLNENHILPIINPKAFFNASRQLCLICKRTFIPGHRHFCSYKEKSCPFCLSYFANEETIIQENIPFSFCFSKLDQKLLTPITCKGCNFYFTGDS